MTNIQSRKFSFGRAAPMLPVSNMQTAYDFYCDLLGFKITFENGDPVGFAILKKDAAEIHLSMQTNHTPSKFNIMHLIVENIDEMYALLEENRIRIIKGIKDKDYGLRAFVFEDPFGNRIDVGQNL